MTPVNPRSSSGVGRGKAVFESVTEEGRIVSVDVDRGVCVVQTVSGRTLEQVKPPLSISSAGGGQRATPMVNSKCLVCYMLPDPARRSYILQVYEDTSRDGRAGEWGSPGEFTYSSDGGGHVTFAQDGLVDLAADPNCRLVLIPVHRETRLWTEHLDVLFSPLSTLRLRQDDEAGASFFELYVNSRYLHRTSDVAPDVGILLGNHVRSELVSPFNPRTGFLAHLFAEAREDADGSVVTHRTDWLSGNVDGVAHALRVESIKEQVVFAEQIGVFGEDVAFEQALVQKDEPVWANTVQADGSYVVANPTWIQSVPAGTDKPWNLTNTETQIDMKGDQLKLGLGSHEPIAKGDTLQGLLEQMIDAILAIVLPTTTGVTTGPPINAAAFQSVRSRLSTLKSTLNHVS